MEKLREMADPASCLNKAGDHELLFVLLERDPSCLAAVEAWINDRIARGLNTSTDDKITSARQWMSEVIQRRGPRHLSHPST
jgi:hypothetical protein